MASESSSAVLELNDADNEDTEATTVTDDTHEGVPLMMEHGYDIAVKVDAPMKQLSTLETYVTYRVRCVCARWPTPPHVRRRYNHFKLLHKRLSAAHPLLAAPPLPPLHSARQQLDRYSPAFVAVRTCALNAFLDRVAKHPILTHSEDFRIFVTTADEELDKVFKSENSALNLWGLSSALYSSGETKAANGPRVKDPEFTSASDYLQSLQHKLTALCSLTTKLHNSTISLGSEFMGMKRACDAWAASTRGRVSLGPGGAALGAGAAARARSAPRAPLAPRAVLPLLAHYAAAHRDKIKQRDAIHAAYVSGTNATDDVHNRLEQASEALRSELADWIPKTQADIKSLLLDLAERQVNIHKQTLHGWEQSLKLATEANIEDIFKTVSKTAVQNLSPSRCRSEMSPTETERDLDEFSDYNDTEEFDGHDDFQRENIDKVVSNVNKNNEGVLKDVVYNLNDDSKSERDRDDLKSTSIAKETKFETNDDNSKFNSVASKSDLNNDNLNANIKDNHLEVSRSNNKTEEDVLSEILEEKLPSGSENKGTSDKIIDPLSDFAEVDLS
ncbi:unnamed protein product [Arctia plantaginis]|uniref:PX domain-containing protein n=1 Tax=Arctia plantaginis TaxID=874455 RepID=A0A8S0YXJ4_ARCPL|nr:unnamed protein product [Arctia plantaginis]